MAIARRARSRARRRAFTLIEAVISTAIVALMLTAALGTLGTAVQSRRIESNVSEGTVIAHDLLTEIIQAHYEEPDDPVLFGREGGETAADRDSWDDVDDFHGWSRSPPRGRKGTFHTRWNGWTRQVDIAFADLADPTQPSAGNADLGLKRITVIVIAPTGEVTTALALRSRESPYERAPVLTSEILTRVGIDLTPTGGAEQSAATNLLNAIPVTGGTP